MIRVEHSGGLQDAKSDVNQLAHGSAHDLHFVFASVKTASFINRQDRDWIAWLWLLGLETLGLLSFVLVPYRLSQLADDNHTELKTEVTGLPVNQEWLVSSLHNQRCQDRLSPVRFD